MARVGVQGEESASGGSKVKKHEMRKSLHQRSGIFGEEGRTCPFWSRSFVMR